MDSEESFEGNQNGCDARVANLFEPAEMQWVLAKRRGIVDPVVIIAPDERDVRPDGSPRMRMQPVERQVAAQWLDPLLPAAAAMVRKPPPDHALTILYQDVNGVTIHECLAPETD